MPGQIFILVLFLGAFSIVFAQYALPVVYLPSPLSSGKNITPGSIASTYSGRFPILNNSTNNASQSNETNAHDFVFGTKGARDQLLLKTTIFKKPKIWNSYVKKEITFPPTKSPVQIVITQVRTQDRGNGTGGFVKIIKGGIGAENVTILFSSHKNKPIHLGLEIYGHRKN